MELLSGMRSFTNPDFAWHPMWFYTHKARTISAKHKPKPPAISLSRLISITPCIRLEKQQSRFVQITLFSWWQRKLIVHLHYSQFQSDSLSWSRSVIVMVCMQCSAIKGVRLTNMTFSIEQMLNNQLVARILMISSGPSDGRGRRESALCHATSIVRCSFDGFDFAHY